MLGTVAIAAIRALKFIWLFVLPKSLQQIDVIKKKPPVRWLLQVLVGRVGLEPTTKGFRFA